MPLPTLSAQITSAGVSAPTYDQIKTSIEESFQAIYGVDIYIAPDSQDGQIIAFLAKAINDSNNAIVAAYNSFRPSGAQGAGLSSAAKLIGQKRKAGTFSTAVGNVVGVNGTVVTGGVVTDNNGNKWDLPATVTIPGAGFLSVTITSQEPGAFAQPAGSITGIATPTFGWQSFVSTADSIPGQAVESDAAMRRRQTTASGLPNITPLGGIQAALEALDGVTRVRIYENATNAVDANGVPARSIAVVIEGGDVLEIATTIGQKKTPGVATFGSDSQNYTDPNTTIVYTINFKLLSYQAVSVAITVQALDGWSSAVAAAIQQSVADYITGRAIGEDVQYLRLMGPAYLSGASGNDTYEITVLTVDAGVVDVVIPYNKAAICDPSNVVITVLP